MAESMTNLHKRLFTTAIVGLVVFASSTVAVGNSLLGKLHGDLLDSCDANQFCIKESQRSCKRLYRAAFSACDPLFYKYPKYDKFSECIAFKVGLKKAKILASIDRKKCPKGHQPYVYESEASNPIDHPLVLEYFTFSSIDARYPALYSTLEQACKAGTQRLKKLNDAKGLSIVTFTINKIRKNETFGSDPQETSFLHLFSTPVYIAGECFGNSKTLITKSFSGFKKGEILNSKYRDKIFVAVQCDKEPKHTKCAS